MLSDTAEQYKQDCEDRAKTFLATITGAATAAGLQNDVVHVVADHPYEAIIATAKEPRLRSDRHGFAWPQGSLCPGSGQPAAAQGAQGLVVVPGNLTWRNRTTIADLALSHRLRSVHGLRAAVAVGGLISLGSNLVDQARRTAAYVDKILKGAKPGDLPIEYPTTFELLINLKTAKALGLTIPPSLLARADQVIE